MRLIVLCTGPFGVPMVRRLYEGRHEVVALLTAPRRTHRGKPVAAVDCQPNLAAFAGPLTVGQYSTPGTAYQVTGRMTDVKIYRRALRAEEVAEKFEAGK